MNPVIRKTLASVLAAALCAAPLSAAALAAEEEYIPESVYEEPAYEEPVYEEPAYEEPVYEEPAYEEPVYEEPAYEEPAYEEPAYEEPAYEEPAEEVAGDASAEQTAAPALEPAAATPAPVATPQPVYVPYQPDEDYELNETVEDLEDYYQEGDPWADVESLEEMESTIPFDALTGDWSEDLITVAESQLGYTESYYNYICNDMGKTKGYTRYGGWFGDEYGDWCAMFVSFCIYYAGIPESAFPQPGGCPQWVDALRERGQWEDRNYNDAARGDIIFFDFNYNDISDHVGIVRDVYKEDGAWWIDVIEGNSSNMVRIVTYPWAASCILGFGRLPTEPSAWVQASLYTDGTSEEPLELEGTEIWVKGHLPGGGTVKASPAELLPLELRLIAAYDVLLLDGEGEEYDLSEDDTVRIWIQDKATKQAIEAGTGLAVVLVEEDGTVREHDPEDVVLKEEDGAVVFNTDHLAAFAVVRAARNLPVYDYDLPVVQ